MVDSSFDAITEFPVKTTNLSWRNFGLFPQLLSQPTILKYVLACMSEYMSRRTNHSQASVIDSGQVLGQWWLLSPGTSTVAQIGVVLMGH